MSESNSLDFILTNLKFLGNVTTKNMFGVTAIVNDGVFFGSYSKGRLFFKVDERSIHKYQSAGMKPFASHGKSMDYYEVPESILSNIEKFQEWAKEALSAAITKQKKKNK